MAGNAARPLAHDQAFDAASDPAATLRAHPMIRPIGNARSAAYLAADFLTPRACRELVALIDADCHPSTVVDANDDTGFRTSETCHLGAAPAVEAIRHALSALLGLPLPLQEPLQGQRYGVGGEFKLHNDWFRPDAPDYLLHCGRSGQRTWTAMAYLDTPEAGGNTIFPAWELDVAPVAGNLLLWNNLRPDGSGNLEAAHHATPVTKGCKHVITAWFRERCFGPDDFSS